MGGRVHWQRRRLYFLAVEDEESLTIAYLLTPSFAPGTYHGDSDLQLERINVYFNEATGGRYGAKRPLGRKPPL